MDNCPHNAWIDECLRRKMFCVAGHYARVQRVFETGGVYFDIDLCKAIASGYMNYASNFLTDADRHYLYDCIRMITFELGARFFTDYVNGDRYFKVRYDGHNLNRALVQFKLCESIEARESQIRAVFH